MRRTFFNIHVPKTAGNTFWDILHQNFGGQVTVSNNHATNEFLSPNAMEWVLNQFRYEAYSSHQIRLSSIPILPDHEMVAISFIRDPVDKFISHYFYSRGHEATRDMNVAKTSRFGDYLEKCLLLEVPARLQLDVSQVEFVCGSQELQGIESINCQKFGTYHVFPLERFDDAMICLEQLYPYWFADCSYGKRSNTSARDHEITAMDIQRAENLPWVPKDRELHKFSKLQIDEVVNGLFKTPEDLESARADFAARCEKRFVQHASKTPSIATEQIPFARRVRSALRILVKGR